MTKKLVCPQCGDVMADAVYRPLAGWLTLTAPDGETLPPAHGSVHFRRIEAELAAASCPADEQAAREHREFLLRNIGELIYALPCHRGHYTMATAGQITSRMRRTKGDWVGLRRG